MSSSQPTDIWNPKVSLYLLSHCQRALNHQAYEKSASYVPQLATKLHQWLDPLPTDRILDVGCGDGKLTTIFSEAARHVVGIDASPMMIEAAQRDFGSPCAEFHVVDCRHLEQYIDQDRDPQLATSEFDKMYVEPEQSPLKLVLPSAPHPCH